MELRGLRKRGVLIGTSSGGIHRWLQPVLWHEVEEMETILLAGRISTREKPASNWSAVVNCQVFHRPYSA